jgi:hypothetical protein
LPPDIIAPEGASEVIAPEGALEVIAPEGASDIIAVPCIAAPDSGFADIIELPAAGFGGCIAMPFFPRLRASATVTGYST